MKIFPKLLLSFLIISLSIFFLSYIAIASTQKIFEEYLRNDGKSMSMEVATKLDGFLYERKREISILAQSHTPEHYLRELLEINDTPAHPLNTVVESLKAFSLDKKTWKMTHIVDKEGVIQASSDVNFIKTKLNSEELTLLQSVFNGNDYNSDLIYNNNILESTMLFASPVYSYNADKTYLSGVIVAYLEWGSAIDFISEFTNMEIKVFNKENKLIAYNKNITKKIAEAENTMEIQNVNTSEQASLSENIQNKIIAISTTKGYKDFKGLNWLLSITYDKGELFAPIYLIRYRIAVIAIILSAISIALGLYTSFSISRPLKLLTNISDKISKGDYSMKISGELLKSKSETGVLSRSFQNMAESLKKSNKEMEKELAIRTKKVNEANKDLEKKINQRTKELEETKNNLEKKVDERTVELRKKLEELEKFNKITIGRELEMNKLKKIIAKLEERVKNISSDESNL